MLDFETYLAPLALTVGVFATIWPLSVVRSDASLVDAWWGPGFFAQIVVVLTLVDQIDNRDLLLAALIGVWSLRLGWVLIRRRLREGHEDPRYISLRDAWDPGFWWKSFFVVFVLQGVIQWVIALGPIHGVIAGSQPLGSIALVGALLAMAGLALETVADRQLDRFKREHPHDALCQTGLRSVMRHPNYLGEIVFWIGIGLIVSEVSLWAAVLSPLVITLFLTQVSGIPMLDERLSASRPGYADYKARVPGLLPGFKK
ncbi:MAG: DUF1295 domain-containing protein [Pseudomonadota bacterium]